MKKLLMLLTLLTSVTVNLCAQVSVTVIRTSLTDLMFNFNKPGTLQHNIDFLLPNFNRMTIEMDDLSVFNQLGSVDSILALVQKGLTPLYDSLTKPLVNRRIDYNLLDAGSQIQITEYPQRGKAFTYKDNELAQVKIEQDTLRIRVNVKQPAKPGNARLFFLPVYITLRLNNISDFEGVVSAGVDSAVISVKRDPYFQQKKQYRFPPVYAQYDVVNKKPNIAVAPVKGVKKFTYYEPYVQLGIQYARGAWVPSSGVGVQLLHGQYNAARDVYRLYLENYFFFSRNNQNNLVTERNDFISFKYNEVENKYNSNGYLYRNFSLSYLVVRRGNWFNRNTFKFAVPGLQANNVVLEPEFIFSKFFKNFSPSLKLTLDIE